MKRGSYKTITPELEAATAEVDQMVTRTARMLDGKALGLADAIGGRKLSEFALHYLAQRFRNGLAAHLSVPFEKGYQPNVYVSHHRDRARENYLRENGTREAREREDRALQAALDRLQALLAGETTRDIAIREKVTEAFVVKTILEAARHLLPVEQFPVRTWRDHIRENRSRIEQASRLPQPCHPEHIPLPYNHFPRLQVGGRSTAQGKVSGMRRQVLSQAYRFGWNYSRCGSKRPHPPCPTWTLQIQEIKAVRAAFEVLGDLWYCGSFHGFLSWIAAATMPRLSKALANSLHDIQNVPSAPHFLPQELVK